jgi:hypothetical protein
MEAHCGLKLSLALSQINGIRRGGDMIKQNRDFQCVQVVSRMENGALAEWYDGEPRATLHEAKIDLKELTMKFPGTKYQIIERIITEIGTEKIG